MINRGINPENSGYPENKENREVHNNFRADQIIKEAQTRGYKAIKFISGPEPSFELAFKNEAAPLQDGWESLEDLVILDHMVNFLTSNNIEVSFDPKNGKMRIGGASYTIDALG